MTLVKRPPRFRRAAQNHLLWGRVLGRQLGSVVVCVYVWGGVLGGKCSVVVGAMGGGIPHNKKCDDMNTTLIKSHSASTAQPKRQNTNL